MNTVDDLLDEVGKKLDMDAKSGILSQVSEINEWLDRVENGKTCETTRKLLEYSKKEYPPENYPFLMNMFSNGNCDHFKNFLMKDAGLFEKYYALRDLPYYILDDVDISLVQITHEESWASHSPIEFKTFAIVVNTWYDDDLLTEKYWEDRLNRTFLETKVTGIKRCCLQYEKFFEMLDVFLDEKNIIEVEHNDFNEDGTIELKTRREFNEKVLEDFIESNMTKK